MLNNRLAAANLVAGQLFSLENAVETAIGESAAMVAALPKAIETGKLSSTIGQDAYSEATAALQQLVAARATIVTLHAHLGQLQTDIGLGARAMGDLWKIAPKSATEQPEDEGRRFSVVSEAA